jgi:glycogen debranching enzyme
VIVSSRSAVELRCGDPTIERAFEIALDDLAYNLVSLKDGLLEREEPVFRAGGGYEKPWTRDAAINVWNGAGLLHATEARNTLLATLEHTPTGLRIAQEYDQYWDAIIWTLGAWSYYLSSGDLDFLSLALRAGRATLSELEQQELDDDLRLFRGPGVYGDGVAAYPDVYAGTKGGHSNILRWVEANPDQAAPRGHGLPMHALSTNCLYARVYEVLASMADAVGEESDPAWSANAMGLREAINRHFWSGKRGHYRYLVDDFGGSDGQEGLGHSFAILFGVADAHRRESIFRTQHVTGEGIACVWPAFDRYRRDGHYGRHSGTIWPMVQGFWAEAAALHGRGDLAATELRALARRAVRDGQFFELYHPETGAPYGGLQEWEGRGIVDDWPSYPHQTWSATAFVRIVLRALAGISLTTDGIRFDPRLTGVLERLELRGIPYRGSTIELVVAGEGDVARTVRIGGREVDVALVTPGTDGSVTVEIELSRE